MGRPLPGSSLACVSDNDRDRAALLASIREDSNMGTGFPKVI